MTAPSMSQEDVTRIVSLASGQRNPVYLRANDLVQSLHWKGLSSSSEKSAYFNLVRRSTYVYADVSSSTPYASMSSHCQRLILEIGESTYLSTSRKSASESLLLFALFTSPLCGLTRSVVAQSI